MIPLKSPLLLTVPPTLEKQLEALAALRTLQAEDEELIRQRRAEIAAVRRDIDKLQRDFLAFRHHFEIECSELRRFLKYCPDQPRVPAVAKKQMIADSPSAYQKAAVDDPEHPGWPAGTPDGKGGQFRPTDGAAGGSSIASAARAESGSVKQPAASTADSHVAQIPPLLFEQPLFARPPLAEFPKDPKLPPGPGFQWKGQPGSQPGDPEGSWYNPKGPETLRPDMNHKPPIGPHWDYKAPGGQWYRWFPDGRFELKS